MQNPFEHSMLKQVYVHNKSFNSEKHIWTYRSFVSSMSEKKKNGGLYLLGTVPSSDEPEFPSCVKEPATNTNPIPLPTFTAQKNMFFPHGEGPDPQTPQLNCRLS